MKLGDLVITHNDNAISQTGILGRIINVFLGKDEIVRVIEVKTPNGIYKRPIGKIPMLPVYEWLYLTIVNFVLFCSSMPFFFFQLELRFLRYIFSFRVLLIWKLHFVSVSLFYFYFKHTSLLLYGIEPFCYLIIIILSH